MATQLRGAFKNSGARFHDSLKIQNIVGALSMVWASWPGMAHGWPLASATLRWPTTPATPTHLLARPLLGVGP